jgi:hypothetical protein
MKKAVWVLVSVGVLFFIQGAMADDLPHIRVPFVPVSGSSPTGHASLVQLPQGGTLITVVAMGLKPGGSYVSLYYGNDHCELEPYSQSDIIGMYTATKAGTGNATGKADDDLDEINSVSVRNAEDFSLVACAKVH